MELAQRIRVLRIAQPELGVKAIVKLLGADDSSVDARTVRDAIKEQARTAAEKEAPAEAKLEEPTPVVEEEHSDVEQLPLTRFSRVELCIDPSIMPDPIGLNGMHAIVGGHAEATNGDGKGLRSVRLLGAPMIDAAALNDPPRSHFQIAEPQMKPVVHPERPSFGALRRTPWMETRSRVNSTGLAGFAAQMYEAIWSGEYVNWQFQHPANDRTKGLLLATVRPEAGLLGTDRQRSYKIRVEILDGRSCAMTELNGDGAFLSYLDDEKSLLIGRRMLHHALHSLEFDVGSAIRHLCEAEFCAIYRSQKRWPELVDLRIVLLDSALAGEYSGYYKERGAIMHSMLEAELAEALEAAGRFEEAGRLYAEAARALAARGHPQAAMVLNNGGLAFKRAACFDDAEELYLEGLRIHKSLASGKCDLRNLLILYETIAQAKIDGHSSLPSDAAQIPDDGIEWFRPGGPQHGQRPNNEDEVKASRMLAVGWREMRLTTVLEELIGATGLFFGEEEDPVGSWKSSQAYRDQTEMLLPAFRNKRGASRGLLEAMGSPNVQAFQKTLLSCSNPRIHPSIVGDTTSPPTYKDERSRAIAEARFRYPSAHEDETKLRSVCTFCGAKWNRNPAYIFKLCTCKSVAYCSTDCQAANWKAHKKAHKQAMCAQKADGAPSSAGDAADTADA